MQQSKKQFMFNLISLLSFIGLVLNFQSHLLNNRLTADYLQHPLAGLVVGCAIIQDPYLEDGIKSSMEIKPYYRCFGKLSYLSLALLLILSISQLPAYKKLSSRGLSRTVWVAVVVIAILASLAVYSLLFMRAPTKIATKEPSAFSSVSDYSDMFHFNGGTFLLSMIFGSIVFIHLISTLAKFRYMSSTGTAQPPDPMFKFILIFGFSPIVLVTLYFIQQILIGMS